MKKQVVYTTKKLKINFIVTKKGLENSRPFLDFTHDYEQ